MGIVGPLGAGKSSLLKLLAGIVPPSGGRALVAGLDLATEGEQVRAHVGYMPGYRSAYDDLRVSEYLDFFARACKADLEGSRAHIDRLVDLAGLQDRRETLIQTLDEEAKQRLAVIKTDLHDPEILLFDEPAVGLAVSARIRLCELIGSLHNERKTIIVCSNILTDLLGLCSRLAVMLHGRLISIGPTDSIAGRLTGARLIELEPAGDVDRVRRLFEAHPAIREVDAHGEYLVGRLAGEVDDPRVVVRDLEAQGARVAAFRELQVDPDLLVEQLIDR